MLRTKRSVYGESEASAPVVVEGAVRGIISLKLSDVISANDRNRLEIISGMASIALKNFEHKEERGRSERRYRSVIENAAEGIYLSTVEGEIVEANQSLVNFFGYESREELEEAGIFKTYRDPYDREKFIKIILEEGEVRNYEIEYLRKDGEVVVGNEFAVLVEGGRFIEGIIHDITELRKAQKKAKFYDSLLRHDMWNKSQVVMGYLELLSDTGLSVEQKNLLERSKLAIRGNMELMVGMKKLHLLEKNQEKEEIDVDEMIGEITNQLLYEAERRGISIYFIPSNIKLESMPLVKEVFYNIILNAIIHSECRNITIRAGEGDGFCRITVEDDGIGIDPEIKKEIFNGMVKGSRGNGMGLYLSARIVELDGGRIEVGNRRDGRGTAFDVYLPMENNFKR